jgi:acetate kinase
MIPMNEPILVLNAGSSSVKFSSYWGRKSAALLFKGLIEKIESAPHFVAHDANGRTVAEKQWSLETQPRYEAILQYLINWMETHLGGEKPAAVGHRVVHGGSSFARATRIDTPTLAKLQSFCPLAPLHQPHNLQAIRAIAEVFPLLPQVACFDTGFHHEMPRMAQLFALPRELHEAGVKRYGFHGLSYEYIASILRVRFPAKAEGRIVVAHLGSGASMCAMFEGRSVKTSMSFTGLDELPMGTRCGALDPGVILYLLRERGMNADQIEDLLYHRSGLFGVSGVSADMRELLGSSDEHASEAVELFVYRVARELGALVATIGGLDGLVFTGGIGEHSPEIRRRVCERSRWLGIALDGNANEVDTECISLPESKVTVWAIPTDEELVIARQTIECLDRARCLVAQPE